LHKSCQSTEGMQKIWDNIVIGSGMGGLSAASLLAKSGQSVLILEKGTSPGGCCSSFLKSGFLFETGATTLIGWEDGLPLERMEKCLGLQFPKMELALSMKVHLDGEVISRYSDIGDWIRECCRVFGNPKRQKMFWKLTFFLSKKVWELSSRYKFFPWTSVSDFFQTVKVFKFSDLTTLFFSFLKTRQVLILLGLGNDQKFIKFLSEQLMITNQCSVEDAPFLFASAGLTYPNLKNYYVPGGMIEIPNTLLNFIRSKGGEYKNKSEVVSIERQHLDKTKHCWSIKTKKDTYHSKNLISDLPIWNLAQLYLGTEKSLDQAALSFEKGIWGAFTLGIAIRADIKDEKCLHHQIHVNHHLPHGGGQSIFVSLSHEEDSIRTKNGIRILSISTHIQEPEKWERKSNEYLIQKEELTNSILSVLKNTFEWFDKDQIVSFHAATPATWFTWTGRKNGRVGGIPTSFFRNPFRYLSPISKISNLYLTGDTIYPGQGIPAVCLGGMNLANRMLLDKERLILP
jgi:C-3',4' desaturase CrtD